MVVVKFLFVVIMVLLGLNLIIVIDLFRELEIVFFL